jgi:hypothetical protein
MPRPHEEILPLEINPYIEGKETNYILKVHYRTIGFSENIVTEEIKQSTYPCHIYYELIHLNSLFHLQFLKSDFENNLAKYLYFQMENNLKLNLPQFQYHYRHICFSHY